MFNSNKNLVHVELIFKCDLKCWLNEKFAPELLEHNTAIVECIIEQLKHMENNIKSAKKGDFRIAVHKLEVRFFFRYFFESLKLSLVLLIEQLDRIKYMLYSYLRLRIKKVFISCL